MARHRKDIIIGSLTTTQEACQQISFVAILLSSVTTIAIAWCCTVPDAAAAKHSKSEHINLFGTLPLEGSVSSAVLLRLVRWFKHEFFSWTNAPRYLPALQIVASLSVSLALSFSACRCEHCGSTETKTVGHTDPTPEERSPARKASPSLRQTLRIATSA